jgi:signal transduction histidine kinase
MTMARGLPICFSAALWVTLLAMLLGVPLRAAAADAEPAVLTIDSASAVLRPEGLPEQHRPVALTHRWDKEFPGRAGRATYVLQLPALDPAQPAALFFERIGNQASLHLNGVPVRQFGTPGSATQDAGKLSQMVLLPAGALSAGSAPNQLVIEASMQPLRAGGLAPVRLGPALAVEALYTRQRLLEQTASAAYAASFLLMGGLAAGLWWRQRDGLYGCFSLAALFGVVRPLDRVWLEAPLPWPLWGAVLAIGYAGHIGLIARFVVLALGRNPRWLVRAIYTVLGLACLGAGLSFWLLVPALWTAALGMLLLLSLVCFGLALHEAFHGNRGMAVLVLSAGSLAVLAGAHDWLFVRMGLFGGSILPLTPHAMFFFVVILAGLVVARYSRSVADYRALNDQLSERVAEREQHLRQAFEALRSQQQEQAVLNERQRIMREIHDGIGSQLVGLLNLVHQRQADPAVLEEQVRLALDEMRMAVDSLQPIHSDLTTVLATLRYRLQPRLQAAGIDIVWDVSTLPPIPGLSPQAILQVQRILLEAFTNVLKHARASRVTVQARWQDGDPPAVLLKLLDNGSGLPAAAPAEAPPGHGIANMRARASAIGASLSIEPAPLGGTCVFIEWPLPAASA